MLNSTILLTAATLLGLVAGFAREWLLVADWGAGPRTDAFLVGAFVSEAVRTMLSGGLLSAAALPLWNEIAPERRAQWLACQLRHWMLLGAGLAVMLALAAPLLVRAIGPGLDAAQVAQAAGAMRWLSLVLPGLMLQAVLTIPQQAQGRFFLPGLASLLFNLPAVLYLALAAQAAQQAPLALCFVAGSCAAAAVLLPGAMAAGWRPWLAAEEGDRGVREIWTRLWPLLASSGASQGLALLERIAASLLGEGVITLVNLARKLINIPLIALMSLNQVLLGRMSGERGAARLEVLRQGLDYCTLLTLPAVVALIGSAPALVQLLLPKGLVDGPLPALLAFYSVAIVFGSWNALLARFSYASGDTRSPLVCELLGSSFQAMLLFALPMVAGIYGLAGAAIGGVAATGILLTVKLQRSRLTGLLLAQLLILALLAGVAVTLFPMTGHGPWRQLAVAMAAGIAAFAALGWRIKPWRAVRTLLPSGERHG